MSAIHSFKRPAHPWLIVASFVLTTPAFAQLVASPPAAAVPKVSVSTTYGKVPLSFEANQGQSDGRVRFLARGQGYGLFLTATEAVLSLRAPARGKPSAGQHAAGHTRLQPEKAAVVRISLAGANQRPQVTGLEPQSGKSNYFIGSDPEQWRRDVPNYARVKYAQVYPGIDLIYYGNQRQLEYDFVVAPGADPGRIELAFNGIERLSLDADGNLVLATDDGQIVQHKPVVYQQIDGERQPIEGHYVVCGKRRARFQVARYDPARPLVIDPVLIYSTYLGGSANDAGYGIAVDAGGNAYVTGETYSTNFPTASPFQATIRSGLRDAFVAKLNPAGSALVYSTYLGGSNDEMGRGIAVDVGGNAYVTGQTGSNDFPTVNPIQAYRWQTDVFVTKLNPAGNALVYSTYLGGTFSDEGRGIAVDTGGNAYVIGTTMSAVVNGDPNSFPFPTANAFQATLNGVAGVDTDNFVTKLNAAGSALVYSTYLGGSGEEGSRWDNSSPDDAAGFDTYPGIAGIAVDTGGNAYVSSETSSTDFPTTAGAFQAAYGGLTDAFVTKFGPAGAMVYSTYLGGSNHDDGRNIAVDGSNNAYITGYTSSTNFPTASPYKAALGGNGNGSTDAFVTKLNPAGSALVYSTYLGGDNLEIGRSIAVDGSGNAYVMGVTSSSNFPTVNPIQAANGGVSDVFLTKLNPAGSALVYSTYLGGSNGDEGVGIAVDGSGNAYVTGRTTSSDFPTVNPFQAAIGSSDDAFVSKISAKTGTATLVSSSLNPSVEGQPVTFTATVSGAAPTGTVQFKDGASNLGAPVALSGGAASFMTSALTVGSHAITAVYGGDSNYDGSTSAVLSQVVQPPFGTPTGLTATSIGVLMPQVSLSWNVVGHANHYEVARRANITGAYVTIGTPASTQYLDFSGAANTTYLYNVRAVDGSGALSAYSNMDPATTVNFTNDPLSAGLTTVKAIHLNELRTAVNAMRTSANLAASTFTDPSVGVSTIIKAIHIQQLRNALQEARLALGLTSGAYTDTLTATTTPIKAVHFQELRDRTK